MSVVLRVLLIVASALYPLLWYLGRGRGAFRVIAVLMLILWLVRAFLSRSAAQRLPALLIAGFFAVLLLLGRADSMYWYPVIVNLLMLIVFAGSLYTRESMIERLARLKTPDLPPHAVAYTRRVTQIWCVFFILNGALAAALVLLEAYRAWALYTGVIAYFLMGGLLGGEWLYRRSYIQKHDKISQT